jgi:hypothetical protein
MFRSRFPVWIKEKWNTTKEDINYRDIVQEYYKIYLEQSENGKVYGKSSEDLLDKIAPIIIKENPESILDYGCGRSSLVNYFWNDGKRKVYKYDPAIREFIDKPQDKIDLIICTDVLEHLPENYMPMILIDLKKICSKIIFTISLRPARKKLPNGMNAHINVRPAEYWQDVLSVRFHPVDIIEETEAELFVKTWK